MVSSGTSLACGGGGHRAWFLAHAIFRVCQPIITFDHTSTAHHHRAQSVSTAPGVAGDLCLRWRCFSMATDDGGTGSGAITPKELPTPAAAQRAPAVTPSAPVSAPVPALAPPAAVAVPVASPPAGVSTNQRPAGTPPFVHMSGDNVQTGVLTATASHDGGGPRRRHSGKCSKCYAAVPQRSNVCPYVLFLGVPCCVCLCASVSMPPCAVGCTRRLMYLHVGFRSKCGHVIPRRPTHQRNGRGPGSGWKTCHACDMRIPSRSIECPYVYAPALSCGVTHTGRG